MRYLVTLRDSFSNVFLSRKYFLSLLFILQTNPIRNILTNIDIHTFIELNILYFEIFTYSFFSSSVLSRLLLATKRFNHNYRIIPIRCTSACFVICYFFLVLYFLWICKLMFIVIIKKKPSIYAIQHDLLSINDKAVVIKTLIK